MSSYVRPHHHKKIQLQSTSHRSKSAITGNAVSINKALTLETHHPLVARLSFKVIEAHKVIEAQSQSHERIWRIFDNLD